MLENLIFFKGDNRNSKQKKKINFCQQKINKDVN